MDYHNMLRTVSLYTVLLLAVCTTAQALDFHFDDVTNTQTRTIDYWEMKLGRDLLYGPYRETKFTFAHKIDVATRTEQMQARILETLPGATSGFGRQGELVFSTDDGDYVLKLHPYAKTATLEVLRKATYTPFIRLNATSWPLNTKLAKKGTDAPLPSFLPLVDEAAIRRLEYIKYDEQVFQVGKQKLSATGRFWTIEYALDSFTRTNSLRYRTAHNLRDLLLDRGAVLYPADSERYAFELNQYGHHLVGLVECYDQSFKLKLIESEDFTQQLALTPDKLKAELDDTGKVILQGIYFDTDKATLKPESNRAITAAATLLRHYDDLELEIQGHTDSQGDDTHNMDLSTRRARAVVDALVGAGIARERLQSRGFGESTPVADNDTDEGRALNRRVEMHRLRGGDSVRVIDIDFIKPLPNAELVAHRQYEKVDFIQRHTLPYAQKADTESFTGFHEDAREYRIIRDGRQDSSFGRVEIIRNYENILPMLGASLNGRTRNELYFTFPDRGDGTPLYGSVFAYEGSYVVRLYIQARTKD